MADTFSRLIWETCKKQTASLLGVTTLPNVIARRSVDVCNGRRGNLILLNKN
jgi:hypothetical protein